MQTNLLNLSLFSSLLVSTISAFAAPQNGGPELDQTSFQSAVSYLLAPSVFRAGYRGSEKSPVTVIVFCDFGSFLCSRSASVLAELVGQDTEVRLIFKHAPAVSNPSSPLAHEAALAAGAQGKFWEMHDLLFSDLRRLAPSDLLDYASQLGLDLTSFQHALDNHTYRPIIERDLAEAKGLGVTTTPTLFINGRRMIGPQGYAAVRAVIDSVLAAVQKHRKVAIEVTASGPAQEINLGQAPAKGPTAAPVSLVEFSDFECPFCAEVAPVLREVLKAYPTQVRISFKHYPLPFHKHAALAHEAALAASEQSKFWEMHDRLFAGQSAISHEDLVSKANELNLDMPRFLADLDSRRFKSVVEADRREGDRLAVDGTPFFFINGHALSGGANLAEFKRVIEAALKEEAATAPK